jgi:hypothetical protein
MKSLGEDQVMTLLRFTSPNAQSTHTLVMMLFCNTTELCRQAIIPQAPDVSRSKASSTIWMALSSQNCVTHKLAAHKFEMCSAQKGFLQLALALSPKHVKVVPLPDAERQEKREGAGTVCLGSFKQHYHPTQHATSLPPQQCKAAQQI